MQERKSMLSFSLQRDFSYKKVTRLHFCVVCFFGIACLLASFCQEFCEEHPWAMILHLFLLTIFHAETHIPMFFFKLTSHLMNIILSFNVGKPCLSFFFFQSLDFPWTVTSRVHSCDCSTLSRLYFNTLSKHMHSNLEMSWLKNIECNVMCTGSCYYYDWFAGLWSEEQHHHPLLVSTSTHMSS